MILHCLDWESWKIFKMDTPALIHALNKDLDVGLKDDISGHELYQKLLLFIENLINNNFPHLVYLLYRIDVSEEKLKAILKKNEGADAAKVITDLIIQRQEQKIESRKAFGSNPDPSSEEKW